MKSHRSALSERIGGRNSEPVSAHGWSRILATHGNGFRLASCSSLSRLSDEFGEAIALTVEFRGVLRQFRLGRPALLEQRANEDESFDLKDDAFDLLIHRSSSLPRRGAAARLRRAMLGLKKLVHESHLSIGH
ncbi:MAG TPA: hypothetical protein VHQ96_07540 [Gaiellaceae bacterium]|nr:hypothetical protein [Gaiellaceae bacterium]